MNRIISKNQENGLIWLLKILSGALIVLVLAVHLIVNHLVAKHGLLNYQDVVTYFQNPLVILMEAVFLICAVTHALSGLRSILLDLNPPERLLKAANVFFWVLGVGAVVYGVWLLLWVARQGA
jgi:succinate dehydrogenase / fumarate reductase, membrane anchor subunit